MRSSFSSLEPFVFLLLLTCVLINGFGGAISEALGSPRTNNSGLESAEFVLTDRSRDLICLRLLIVALLNMSCSVHDDVLGFGMFIRSFFFLKR